MIYEFRLYLVAIVVFLSNIGCQSNGRSGESDRHPNVIVFLTDDQGWGDLSINGNSNMATPNVDGLAREGAIFERFYVSPVCSPTRAEFLTGRYHLRSGISGTSEGYERMDLKETTIAEVFKAAGYRTAAFGKWHNGMQYPYHPNARGFDEFYGFCSGHWGNYFSPMLEHNGEIVKGNGYTTNDFTEKAIDYIDQNKDAPFFMYVAYNTPHSPMQVPNEWWDRFKDKEIALRASKEHQEDLLFTKAALAMCENIDWNIGRVLQKLKEDGLDKNTVIVYFHDNGPNSWRWNGGFKGKKGSIDEGGVRSPLIVRYPGEVAPETRITSIAGAIDLLPTLTDLAQIDNDLSQPLDGRSLKPLLLRNNERWPERYLFSHWNGRTGIRDQRYFYTWEGALYDIEADPTQKEDLADANDEIRNAMAAELEKWETRLKSSDRPAERLFPVGHPEFEFTQLPARDGKGHGNITRSDDSPNCTYFTNWTDVNDKITWSVEVLEDGDFDVELYYTCDNKNTGSNIELSMDESRLQAKISTAYDPPLHGMEHDRILRTQSYVKDFGKMRMGTIHLKKGTGQLQLKALNIPGDYALDFRLLMLKRVAE